MSKPSGQTTLAEKVIRETGKRLGFSDIEIRKAINGEGAYGDFKIRVFVDAALEAADSGLAGKMEVVALIEKRLESMRWASENAGKQNRKFYSGEVSALEWVKSGIVKALAPTDAGQDRDSGK